MKGDRLPERNEKLALRCNNILGGVFGGVLEDRTTAKGTIVDDD